MLALSDNQLSGEIPESLCDIGENPSWIIYMLNNQLCPPYPDCLPEENIGYQDTSECPPIIWGCMDEEACNYNPDAHNDDGSCDVGYVVLWDECYNIEETTSLDLSGSNLTGSIPLDIGNLVNLNYLDLAGNQLTGEIPSEIGGLYNLSWLSLCYNQLEGSIPLEIFDLDLDRLYLQGNYLSGQIPPEIGNLINLGELGLSDNNLTGSIPPEIGNLVNLTGWIYLSNNDLSGSIPPEIGNLVNCYAIFLHNNQLSGPLPNEIGNLTNLIRLQLDGNQISGEIPKEIGDMENLQYLGLAVNQFSGEIPEEIGNLTNLKELYLNVNQLTGEIPGTIENLINLDILYVNDNQLTGAIPGNICNLPELGNDGYPNYLEFNDNNFCLPYPVCLTAEQLGEQNTSECMYDYNINLHSNANLISFMSLPSDNYVGTVLESIEGAVTGIIGQGVASSPNPALGWIGSLTSIEYPQGYWIKMTEPGTITISSLDYPGSVNSNYMLSTGANLISFPFEGPSFISDVLPDDIEPYITDIIGEGQAATQNPTLGWIGSLNALEGSKGYWFKVSQPIEFQFILPDSRATKPIKTPKIK